MMQAGRLVRRRSRYHGERRKVAGLFTTDRIDYGRKAARGVYESQFSVHVELPDLDASGRPIYSQEVRRTGRRDRRSAERAREAQIAEPPVDRKRGIRADVALVVLAVMLATLGTAWLIDRSSMSATSKKISELQARIVRTQDLITDKEEEYSAAAASVDVGYAAIDLGMISTKGSSKIYLYAPEEAVMGPVEVTGGTMTQFATISGD